MAADVCFAGGDIVAGPFGLPRGGRTSPGAGGRQNLRLGFTGGVDSVGVTHIAFTADNAMVEYLPAGRSAMMSGVALIRRRVID